MIKESQPGVVCWDIPAGGLNQGENIFDGVKREVLEEVGIIIKNPILITTFQTISNNEGSFCFLFKYALSVKEYKQLNITEADILEAKLFLKEGVKTLIESSNTEHKLAKRKLMEFVSDNRYGKVIVL